MVPWISIMVRHLEQHGQSGNSCMHVFAVWKGRRCMSWTFQEGLIAVAVYPITECMLCWYPHTQLWTSYMALSFNREHMTTPAGRWRHLATFPSAQQKIFKYQSRRKDLCLRRESGLTECYFASKRMIASNFLNSVKERAHLENEISSENL